MKQYLLSVHVVEGEPDPSDEEMQTMFRETGRINDEMQAAGAWVFAGGLRSPDSATVVRIENGATTMSDGPFAETKEHIAGFWVIKCADLDQALAWAEQCAAACGPIEVRPFDDLSQA
ncbi:YciI family protein [Micromonospora sp. NPDC049171]|uniref:YciI family protein n=1 Tax=Micromonospora sp. NPDC049171 TaxID=3155770 RepID=UPI0034055FA9